MIFNTLQPQLCLVQAAIFSGIQKANESTYFGKVPKQMLSDKIIGWTFIGLSTCCVVLYTVWVVFLPFVDEEQLIHQYFPDQYYAVALPLLAGVIGLVLIGGFVLYALNTSDNSDSLVTDDSSSIGSKKQL